MIHFFNGYVYVYMPTHTQANQHIFTQTHVSFPLFSSIKKKHMRKIKQHITQFSQLLFSPALLISLFFFFLITLFCVSRGKGLILTMID